MTAPALALYVLCHVSATAEQHALPDLEQLVYSAATRSTIPPNQRQDWKEQIEEGLALARYLNRVQIRHPRETWDASTRFNLLTVLQQFDATLSALNPTPGVEEAVTRVRAYRVWLVAIHRSSERARGRGEDVENADRYRYFSRAVSLFEQNYAPLFTADFQSCDPTRVPPLPSAPPVIPPTLPPLPAPNVGPVPPVAPPH